MRILKFLFVFLTYNAFGQLSQDSLPALTIVFNDHTAIDRKIFVKTNSFGQDEKYIIGLTTKQIAAFDSIFVKKYRVVSFDGYSVDRGSDFWVENKTNFDEKVLESIRAAPFGAKEVGFSLKLINLETNKEIFIKNISIYSYRRLK